MFPSSNHDPVTEENLQTLSSAVLSGTIFSFPNYTISLCRKNLSGHGQEADACDSVEFKP